MQEVKDRHGWFAAREAVQEHGQAQVQEVQDGRGEVQFALPDHQQHGVRVCKASGTGGKVEARGRRPHAGGMRIG